MRYYLSVDLGEVNDYTAISVLEQVYEWKVKDPMFRDPADVKNNKLLSRYHVVWIERMRQSYPDVQDRIKTLIESNELKFETELIVDATGVGRAVIDNMRRKKLNPIAITITGGNQVTRTDEGYNVPKRDLSAALQFVFQSQRIKFADFPETDVYQTPSKEVIIRELQSFTVRINRHAHDQYEAAAGVHDDIVLSLAMGLWYAEKQRVDMVFPKEKQKYDAWSPYK